MASRHVVFVSQLFYPDSQAVSQLFTSLFKRLAEDGTRVTVLCAHPAGAASATRHPRHERRAGMEIHRCGLRVDAKRSYAMRAVSYGSFLLEAGWKLLRLRRKDVLLGVTNPPFLLIALRALSKLGRFRYDYMALDVYPEGLIALGKLRRRSLVARAWMALNRWSYRGADRIFVLGRDMIPLLSRNYGLPAERLLYVPHWSPIEPSHPVPFSKNVMARELGLGDRFVVQYSGNMGLWHDMEALVLAAGELRADPRIEFLFIGRGIRRAAAEALARRLELRNVRWLDFVLQDRLEETLTCCHAALISLRAGLSGVAVPSKLYGILATGRPALAQVPADSEVALTIREHNCGVVVEPGDVRGMASAIRGLVTDPARAESLGANALAAYRANFTLDHAVHTFRAVWGPAGARDGVR